MCSHVSFSASCRFIINSSRICCINRSDFLSLPFQAIECNLAGVKPKGNLWYLENVIKTALHYLEDVNSIIFFLLHRTQCLRRFLPGDEWTEAALDDFDRLTHCASWRPLLAKLCSYSHFDMSSWPSVKLCDSNDGTVSKSSFNLLSCCFDFYLLKQLLFLGSRYWWGAHTPGPRCQFPGSGEREDWRRKFWQFTENAGES